MSNKRTLETGPKVSDLSMPSAETSGLPNGITDRRKISRQQDKLYQFVVALNMLAWAILIGALIVLHYARPEFISGVQTYWGIDGRDFWSKEHLSDLLTLLQVCLFITIATIVLRSRRNRRKTDRFGVNVLILLVISVTSLVTIYVAV